MKQYFNHELSNAEYHATKELSSSHIAVYHEDPYKYWNRFINDSDVDEGNEKAFLLGSAVHTLVLEPALFEQRYAVAPVCDRRTKAGKEMWNLFLEDSKGKEVLDSKTFNEAVRLRNGVIRNPLVKDILDANGILFEHSFFWNGFKCRADALMINEVTNTIHILDLKTTQSVNKRKFEYSVRDFHYDLKAGFYAWVISQFYPDYDIEFALIVVDKTPEANCTIFEFPDHILKKQMEIAEQTANELKDIINSDNVPRFKTSIPEITTLFED